MAKFASAQRQAGSVMKALQGDAIKSVGTVRNYEQALTRVAEWTKEQKISNGLRSISPEQAIQYLEQRSADVGPKTLDMERQAIQAMMRHVTEKLAPGERLDYHSDKEQALSSRAYTSEQVQMVSEEQQSRNALATQIAYASGLRAHEIPTLAHVTERPMDQRPTSEHKFQGREGVRYTVEGKGGLVREVSIPKHLASQLESRRLNEPKQITDRGVRYITRYDIGGGQSWSKSFSDAANRALGWSEGAHGVRHSYAQERMSELQRDGLSRHAALLTVSQEMGHFRPEITEVYLR